MSVRSACFIDKALFLVKLLAKLLGLGTIIFKCWIIRVFGLLDVRLKEICSSRAVTRKFSCALASPNSVSYRLVEGGVILVLYFIHDIGTRGPVCL